MLFCLPKAACDWLELDVNSKVDCTVDILNSTLTLKKTEVENGTRRIDTIDTRDGSISTAGDSKDSAISKTTTEASTIVPSVDTIDAQLFSTTAEGEEAFENESDGVPNGLPKEDLSKG